MARVYADVNQSMPRSYWDYDGVNISQFPVSACYGDAYAPCLCVSVSLRVRVWRPNNRLTVALAVDSNRADLDSGLACVREKLLCGMEC